MSLLHRLYGWTLTQAGSRHAMPALFGISFIESSIFPIPPDVLVLPMVLARRENAWLVATVATLGSVLGGLAGYAIGFFLYEAIGAAILEFYGYSAQFREFTAYYNEWGAWIVAGAGFTPFPYKVITIASGVTQLDLAVFMVASALSRGGRFFLLAGLLWWFGPPIRRFVEAYLPQLTILFFLLLVGGFVALKYLV